MFIYKGTIAYNISINIGQKHSWACFVKTNSLHLMIRWGSVYTITCSNLYRGNPTFSDITPIILNAILRLQYIFCARCPKVVRMYVCVCVWGGGGCASSIVTPLNHTHTPVWTND